ncbi:hypothetical protein FQN53_005226 [Emmonsiellopsis sp. PD_33]|nr:hypothetical protein FQN53_005226 [Emmonsiellopsis sp. PD_33]
MLKFLKNIQRKKQNSVNNGQSPRPSPFPFLSLPPEIRNQIYFNLFQCNQAVHLFQFRERIFLARCDQSTPHHDESCCYHSTRDTCAALGFVPEDQKGTDIPKSQILNLVTGCGRSVHSIDTAILYTNKQLSTEAAAVLYSSLSFEAAELKTWVLVANMISPLHLAMIKRLHSTWAGLACLTMPPVPPGGAGYDDYEQYTLWDDQWEDFWEIVTKRMVGLVELGFFMDYQGMYLSRAPDAKWLTPLMRVRGLKKLNVWVWDRLLEETRTGDKEETQAETVALNEFLRGVVCQEREGGGDGMGNGRFIVNEGVKETNDGGRVD